jgi:hypothetical protein
MPRKRRNMSTQDERQMRSRGRMLRATAYKYIPDRDTVDEITGETWEGIPGIKMAVNAVDSDVLASGGTNAERAVDTAHIKTGAVTKDRVNTAGRWAKDDQHGDTLYKNAEGKLPAADLPATAVTGSYNGNPGRLGYGDIGGTPDLSVYAKDADLKNRPTKSWVKREIEKATRKKKN